VSYSRGEAVFRAFRGAGYNKWAACAGVAFFLPFYGRHGPPAGRGKRIRIWVGTPNPGSTPPLLHAQLAHYFATSSAEFELDLCSVWRASWYRVK